MVSDVGRNDPCPCGSGKKYKYCCMEKDRSGGNGSQSKGNGKVIEFPGEKSMDPAEADLPSQEAFRTLKRGKQLNFEGKYEEARRTMKKVSSELSEDPMYWNNRALVELSDGNYERGIDYARKALEQDPNNLFSNCLMALGCSRAGSDDPEKWVGRALGLNLPVFPAEHQVKLLTTLAVLGRYSDVVSTFEHLQTTPEGEVDDFLGFYAAGVSYANQDKYKQAIDCFKNAIAREPDHPAPRHAKEALNRIKAGEIPPFTFRYEIMPGFRPNLVPPEVLEELDDEKFHLSRTTLVFMLWNGTLEGQRSTLGVLEDVDDPWVTELLFSMLENPELPDPVKLDVAGVLLDKGEVSSADELEIHLEGELRSVAVQHLYSPSEKVHEKFMEAVRLKQEERYDRAEQLYLEIIEEEPEFIQAYMNLGNLYRSTGRLFEAEKYLDKAIELGDQPRAHLNRAGLAYQRGKLDRVEQTLDRFDYEILPEDDDRYLYARMKGGVLLEKNERSTALKWFQKALDLNPEDQQLRNQVEKLKFRQEIDEESFERLRNRKQKKRNRYLNKTIDTDMSLKDLLMNHIKNRLKGMASALGMTGYSSLNKEPLAEEITDYIKENITSIINQLKQPDKKALRWILDRDGMVSYEEWTEEFGSESEDPTHWAWNKPTSVPGRLKLTGLVHTGTDTEDDTRKALVPAVIEDLLSQRL